MQFYLPLFFFFLYSHALLHGLKLGLRTHNPRFVAWPLELGLGTHNPRFVVWPLKLGLGTHNPRLGFLLELVEGEKMGFHPMSLY